MTRYWPKTSSSRRARARPEDDSESTTETAMTASDSSADTPASMRYPTFVDEVTVRRARRGDAAAISQVYAILSTPAFNLAYRMTLNRQQSEDVLHDTFIKVIANLHKYRGQAPLWAWVRQVLVNTCLNAMKRESRHQHHDSLTDDYGRETIADPVNHDHDHARLDAMTLLGQLSEKYRTVLILHDLEGLTHPEIAALFEQTESFSKSVLFRARKQLNELTRDHDTED